MRFPLFLLLAGALAHAADPSWTPGFVLEFSSDTYSQVAGAIGMDNGNTSNVQISRQSWDENVYIIDGQDRVFIVRETIGRIGNRLFSFKTKRATNMAPGDDIAYAVDGGNLRVRTGEGKEHKLRIIRVVLKEKRAPRTSEDEFQRQLRLEFPEIAEDSDRITRGLAPQTELFTCAAAAYRAAVALDPSLEGSPGALLLASRQARAELAAGPCLSRQ